jgi:hypothetical protein
VDFIPTEQYFEEDAARANADAAYALGMATRLIEGDAPGQANE